MDSGEQTDCQSCKAAAYSQLDQTLSGMKVQATTVAETHVEHNDHASTKSERRVQHRGRQIKVVTTYEISIDGKPVSGHFEVNDAGKVHCHDLPNYAFDSALEMAQGLVDLIGENPIEDELNSTVGSTPRGQQGEHGEHSRGQGV